MPLTDNSPRGLCGKGRLARTLFGEMQREYVSGNFARYGELLQQLGKLLQP